MSKFEFLSLLKQYQETTDETDKQSILSSLQKLSSQQKEVYQELRENGMISDEIDSCLQKQETPEPSQKSDEISRIYQAYRQWLSQYQPNQEPSDSMKQIVNEIVSFYAPNRFGILERLFDIQDSSEFEAFKLHIKNRLRSYFAEQITTYVNSSRYQNLSWIQRYRKDKKLQKVMNNIIDYKFEPNKLKEVFQ